ncbi:unnamed protein product [Tetraodon nigroviridis]|uniref:(spotted green pufferfish) hypothetical protein n=1 Tax=Tetraodon nigroviridis TaxID=99883 RepID=Q4SD97_TETNG|nr:unnamed protein product [Tetraodon nigroviridis]
MAPGGVPLPLTGILIAVAASFINGSTFVLQRKGILRSRERGKPHEYIPAYLSPWQHCLKRTLLG